MGSIAADEAAEERVRLHITPFTPELLNKIIAPSILPLASNISFHTVQTFPERGFGYVELPVMAAQKVKQKLNGSTLKGTKVHVENAKPERKRKVEKEIEEGDGEGEEGEDARKFRKMARREKRKREEGVISGHELEEGRRVKRGWTDGEAKDSKRRKKDDKTVKDDGEDGSRRMRFKTSLPPNTVLLVEDAKDKPKKKKDKDKEERRENKKKTVVEEFKKTKKPRDISLKSSEVKQGAVSYEDGKGWVDESGDVVEAERPSKKPKRRSKHGPHPNLEEGVNRQHDMEIEEPVEDVQQDQDVPEDPSEIVDVEQDQDVEKAEGMQESEIALEGRHVHNLQNLQDSQEEETPPPQTDDVQKQGSSPDYATALSDQEETTPPAKEVHPLEALFKRPATAPDSASKPRPGPIDTSFSFFVPGEDQEDDGDAAPGMPPQTPHTKRDLEWRSLRSAAPTPDTAAIGRKFSFPFAGHDDDDEEEDGDDGEDEDLKAQGGGDVEMRDDEQAESGAAQANDGERGEESAFRKWFYEHRGDFNRGWKKRRRDERKQKRQRDNRRFSQKVAKLANGDMPGYADSTLAQSSTGEESMAQDDVTSYERRDLPALIARLECDLLCDGHGDDIPTELLHSTWFAELAAFQTFAASSDAQQQAHFFALLHELGKLGQPCKVTDQGGDKSTNSAPYGGLIPTAIVALPKDRQYFKDLVAFVELKSNSEQTGQSNAVQEATRVFDCQVRRTHILALSICNGECTVKHYDRSGQLTYQSFQLKEHPEILFLFIANCMFASSDDLGYFPSPEEDRLPRVNEDKANRLEGSSRCVLQVDPTTLRKISWPETRFSPEVEHLMRLMCVDGKPHSIEQHKRGKCTNQLRAFDDTDCDKHKACRTQVVFDMANYGQNEYERRSIQHDTSLTWFASALLQVQKVILYLLENNLLHTDIHPGKICINLADVTLIDWDMALELSKTNNTDHAQNSRPRGEARFKATKLLKQWGGLQRYDALSDSESLLWIFMDEVRSEAGAAEDGQPLGASIRAMWCRLR